MAVTGLQFLGFTVFVAVIIYLHFFLAHRELRRLREEQPLEINWRYVRTEDFFGQSFRQKLQDWLQLPGETENGGRVIKKGNERIVRVTSSVDFPPRTILDDVLVVDGDFSCGADGVFSREIYVRGNCRVGAGSRVQAIAVDGNLTLEPFVTVVRWCDTNGVLDVGKGATIKARSVSRTRVQLAPDSKVVSVYAPEVATNSYRKAAVRESPPAPVIAIEIPLPSPQPSREALKGAGLDPGRLHRLSEDCWLHKGDLQLSAPLRLKTRLVVKGNCWCPAGSVLEEDLKADGSLQIGEGSVCHGNLVADGDIKMGRASRFSHIIHAGGTLRLGSGVLGFHESAMVVAYAVGHLFVANGVTVKGKLASGERVVALPANGEPGSKTGR